MRKSKRSADLCCLRSAVFRARKRWLVRFPIVSARHRAQIDRMSRLGIPQTQEARRAYRELIVTTPGLGECISGVILCDETIRQQKKDGTPFVKVITDAGRAKAASTSS